MFLIHRLIRSVLCLALAFGLANCSLKYVPKTEEDFSREMARLKKLAHGHEDVAVRANSHLKLAWLYLNNKNPKWDYRKAARELESYLFLIPGNVKTDEIENWLSVLYALERVEKENESMKRRIEILTRENAEGRELLDQQVKKNQRLQTNTDRLQESHQKLQGNIEKLQESNERLKEMIERLKNLDLEIEEKRRTIK